MTPHQPQAPYQPTAQHQPQPPHQPGAQPAAAPQPPVPHQQPYGYQYAAPQGYGPQYGAPYAYGAGYPEVGASGSKFWALTFLFFIPYLGFLISPIVASVLCASERRNPHERVRENARWAANWSLTVLMWQVIGFVLIGFGIALGVAEERATGSGAMGLALVIPGVLLGFGMGVVHLIVAIVGTVQAGSRVVALRLAIPFIRNVR